MDKLNYFFAILMFKCLKSIIFVTFPLINITGLEYAEDLPLIYPVTKSIHFPIQYIFIFLLNMIQSNEEW